MLLQNNNNTISIQSDLLSQESAINVTSCCGNDIIRVDKLLSNKIELLFNSNIVSISFNNGVYSGVQDLETYMKLTEPNVEVEIVNNIIHIYNSKRYISSVILNINGNIDSNLFENINATAYYTATKDGVYTFSITKISNGKPKTDKGCVFIGKDTKCLIIDYLNKNPTTDVHIYYNILTQANECNCYCDELCKMFKYVQETLNPTICKTC